MAKHPHVFVDTPEQGICLCGQKRNHTLHKMGAVLVNWKANNLSYAEAVRQMVELGMDQEKAHILVAKT